jgi:hypothetical protein
MLHPFPLGEIVGESYCCCCEGHKVSEKCYLHIYILNLSVKDCAYVRSCTDWVEGGIDVKPCKSEHNWLNCISKEDEKPYFNVAVDKLSFNYRALCWARNTEKFPFTDAFMDIL